MGRSLALEQCRWGDTAELRRHDGGGLVQRGDVLRDEPQVLRAAWAQTMQSAGPPRCVGTNNAVSSVVLLCCVVL